MDLKKLWERALADVELQISKPNFLTWFKNSRLVEKNNETGTIIIGVANNFAKEWIQSKYHKMILEILRVSDESINRIEYVVLTGNIEEKIFSQTKTTTPTDIGQAGFVEFSADPDTNLHPRYGFKNFVVGSSNELAYAAANAVSKDPGKKYNPLFVYGGTGLGKTHLIQAIGNEILKTFKNRIKVKYVPSEKFVNDVVWAIRTKRMEDIKNKYRTIDVLIIDDIQFIGGKERSEEEFFHTFNMLYQNNKQIIISSDRPPSQIPTLEDRLRSRFEGGMIADITYPDYEMKMAIIKNKIQEKSFDLSDEVAHFIATKIQRNIREIEGIINKLYFYKEFKNAEIDLKIADEIVSATLQQNMVNINPQQVIKCVAEFFEIGFQDLINKSRRKEVVLPRQIAMFLMRDMLGMSYPDIGDRLGKRDHTTAIHSYEKILREMTRDKILNQKIILVKEVINKNPA
ncbi:MAG TPA: chromosomal replication initiator protein DnaA [Candidatus Paceibacterota bacterium]|nr:chromosomal replication initiator protein DnaA [Candidatus Paceibacterota bacterium]